MPLTMAEKVLLLMDNRQLRLDMGRAAQEWIRRQFNWDQMAAGYAKVFLEVAAGEPQILQMEINKKEHI